VLIKGLVRKGEAEPCDRIFIIGGRDRDGFVPEVDVFNLQTNQWETDWPGLNDGELENIPASIGGGNGTTIVIGGGNCTHPSIRAGNGINITVDNRNLTIHVIDSDWEDLE
jgi:hypothetical protein